MAWPVLFSFLVCGIPAEQRAVAPLPHSLIDNADAAICSHDTRSETLLLADRCKLWKQSSDRDESGLDGFGTTAVCAVCSDLGFHMAILLICLVC